MPRNESTIRDTPLIDSKKITGSFLTQGKLVGVAVLLALLRLVASLKLASLGLVGVRCAGGLERAFAMATVSEKSMGLPTM